MRRTVPSLARRALLEATETGVCSSSSHALRPFASAAPTGPKQAATPTPGSPTAAAQAAIKSAAANPDVAAAGAASRAGLASSSSSPAGGPDTSNNSGGGGGGGGGGGWFLPVLTLAAAGGGYYAYTQQSAESGSSSSSPFQQTPQQALDATQKAAVDLLHKGKDKVQSLLPSILGGGGSSSTAAKPSTTSSSSSNDKHLKQKQRDQEESGFRMLPPGSEDASAAAEAADAATAASAAARDSLSAAADEFPGSSSQGGAKAGGAPAADDILVEDLGSIMGVEHIDLSAITDLFADVTGTSGATPAAAASSSSKQGKAAAAAVPSDDEAYKLMAGVHSMHGGAASTSTPSPSSSSAAAAAGGAEHHTPAAAGMAAAAAALGAAAGAGVAAPVLRPAEDSELEKLCQKLGLSKDLAPAGLVAAANSAGLGATNTSGGHLPPQMAQLNQATADARVLRAVLDLAASKTTQLLHELEEAKQKTAWTEEAAARREASLTEHFKELMREQSRIHQELTAAAVKEAEQVVIADTAKAHVQERQERLQLINELREKVNALSLAFEQRTAQLRSSQEVNKVSVGMLSLSKALEEGAPIGPQLQQLASSCPGDPLVEAVAASLPSSAVSEGLPTMQQLRASFNDVAQAAAEAAYFSGQEGQGGVLAHLAAKIAVKLKVDAGADVANSVDSKVSQARALLQQGQLSAAAEALMAAGEGTQAAAVVQQWVADARARAAADQAVKLLQAHATATAGLTA